MRPRAPAARPAVEASRGTIAPDYLGAVYTLAILTPLLALAASWRWARAAALLGILSGLLAVALPALILALGAGIAWRGWPLARLRLA